MIQTRIELLNNAVPEHFKRACITHWIHGLNCKTVENETNGGRREEHTADTVEYQTDSANEIKKTDDTKGARAVQNLNVGTFLINDHSFWKSCHDCNIYPYIPALVAPPSALPINENGDKKDNKRA